MSSYTHYGSRQPGQSVSYAKVSSISSVPPFERAYSPSAAQWPNSNFSKRRLCRQRKHLAWLSYALMVVFVFGIYFCRLKGSSGNGPMVTNRKLSETDRFEEAYGQLEENVDSELCEFIDESTGSAEQSKAPGEPSALPESAEVQARTLSGKRKRKKTQEDTGASTSRQQDTAEAQPSQVLGGSLNTLLEGSGDGTGTDEQLMKRARILEWSIDPVEDLDFLLSTRQSISPGGFTALELQALLNTGNNGLNGSVASTPPVSFPGASQVQGTANGSSPQVHFWGTTGGAYATRDTSEIKHAEKKKPAVEAPATLASSSLQYPAGSSLPQVEGGRTQAQELAAVVHVKPSKSPIQEHSTEPQDLHRATEQGTQQNYKPPSSSASSTQSILKTYLIARASARRQGGNVAQPGPSDENTPVDPSIREKLLRHPFYRLPSVEPGVLVHYFDWMHAVGSSVFPRQLAQKLLDFQRIICKDTLSQNDVNELGLTTWELLRDAASKRITVLTKPSFFELVEPLAHRFLLVDALFCACEILGGAAGKEHWWPGVMSKLAAPPVLMGQGEAKATPEVKQFVESVCAALRIYQRGDRPPPEVVVDIKMKLFGEPPIHRAFSRVVWNWWRRILLKPEQSQ